MADPTPDNPALAAAINYEVPADLLARALERLGLKDGALAAEAVEGMASYVCNYQVAVCHSSSVRTATAEKKSISKAARYLEKALAELKSLAPGYVMALDALGDELDDKTSDVVGEVSRAHRITARCAAVFKPLAGRDPDIALREAVQGLGELFAELDLEPPRVRMNKANGKNPQLRSLTALAMGELLMGVNPNLTETALVNMIEDVRRHPGKDEDLMRLADWISSLDLSLHPSRSDPEARRRYYWED